MTDLEPAPAPPLPVLPVEQRPTHDPYQVYLDSLKSLESKRTMKGALDRIARTQTGDPAATGAWQPWWLLRYEHTIGIRSTLVDYRDPKHPNGYSPSHVNKHLIALRQVLRVCWRMGMMSADEYERAADVKSLDVHRLPAGRNIHRDELAAMLKVCAEDEGPAAMRNAALIAVLYSTGMRRAEAADALLERYDAGERTLRIIGKRGKEREVYISPSAVPILDRWLSMVGTRRGPMFRPIHRTGKIQDGPMTPRAVGYIADRTRRKAGLAPLATHDFRRTHTGDLLDAGVDLATAQRLLGHASPMTTAAYDRRPGRAARAAADRLVLPSPESLRDEEPERSET
ncbi:MAG: integrase family protein [Streptosporangiaceae bacterium]|nr:integrase family protein [Streptosporangiaceae bacterium]